MIQTALDRIKADAETQDWWQAILNNPRYALVLEAAKQLLEQKPPPMPPGANPLEVYALAHSAALGAKAALGVLETLGAASLGEARLAEAKRREQDRLSQPANLGTGYGARSAPPPELGTPPPQTPP